MTEGYDAAYAQEPDYFGRDASPLLGRFHELVPAAGRVLDIGIGQGRNGLALAERGCRVTGIDTSDVALEQVRRRAGERRVELELWRGSFLDYDPAEPFDVVLCFGLLQMLDRAAGASLVHRWWNWTRPGGVLFATAWHVDDPSYSELSTAWIRTGLHTFQGPDGQQRLFLARSEILDLLLGWRIVHHWEGLGPEHRHGAAEPERHGLVEAVAVRLG
jgi:SAM-dependent methyltransferase